MIGLTKALTSCMNDKNAVSHEGDAQKVKELIEEAAENMNVATFNLYRLLHTFEDPFKACNVYPHTSC